MPKQAWPEERFGPRALWEPGAEAISVFDVHEGRPSWHQQRAGHISAAVTSGFQTRAEAEAYCARLKETDPVMPTLIIERKVEKS